MKLTELIESLGKESLYTIQKIKFVELYHDYEESGKVVFTSDSKDAACKERDKLQQAEKGTNLYKLVYDYVKPLK